MNQQPLSFRLGMHLGTHQHPISATMHENKRTLAVTTRQCLIVYIQVAQGADEPEGHRRVKTLSETRHSNGK